MKECQQSPNQNVYEHGLSVYEHLKQLIFQLEDGCVSEGWKIPNWMMENRLLLLAGLEVLDNEDEVMGTLHRYAVFHDCGKPFCRVVDSEGRQHFPGHAEMSAETYGAITENRDAVELIRLDMKMHTLKSDEVTEFAANKYASTLLLSSLAEIHANAKMFGGIESVSFKIKWKHLDRKGKAVISQIKDNVK